uniref:Peptidase M14 domain-containing protein n=1 Tax=Glossina austeni TaxID=7395 RepID=A0A1A9VDE5_GLOAU
MEIMDFGLSKENGQLDWSYYPTLDEIYNWLDLIIRTWPNIVTGFNIGYSYEGRLIRGVKLCFKSNRKAIFIESNIHAREWITSAACTYLIFELLFSRDPDVRQMANRVDWWIVPVLNVDGFVYSHEKERLWRKSRRYVNPGCIGVDLNRNFEYQWGRIKHDPCSNQYGGSHPLSEPEVEQLTKFINSNIPEGTIKIYIALHAAAQAVLLPWTHTKELPLDYKRLMIMIKPKITHDESKKIVRGTYASELRRAKDCTVDGGTITRKQKSSILIRNLFPKKRPTYRVLDWSFYPTLCEIYAWIDSIIKEWPKVVTGFDIGRSHEGRLIRGLKLSFGPGKKAIFIESNIHAREWITSATCTYLIRELLFSRDPDVRELAESLDWWIIPVLNVDGFAFSHEEQCRLWRKSRRPCGGDCFGIDLNRNFGYKWELRKCEDPSSNMYSGPHAESEPEVKQLTKFINNNIPDGSIKIYIALHAAAQAVLIPWAFTNMRPRHYDELLRVAEAFAGASFRRYRTRYLCATMANVLKLVSGTSTDWAHGTKGIPIAYCLELPGKGTPKRFELPEHMIVRNRKGCVFAILIFALERIVENPVNAQEQPKEMLKASFATELRRAKDCKAGGNSVSHSKKSLLLMLNI